jgi:hypothetical protein
MFNLPRQNMKDVLLLLLNVMNSDTMCGRKLKRLDGRWSFDLMKNHLP